MKDRGGLATTIALLIAAILGASYIPRKAADSTSAGGGAKAGSKATDRRQQEPATGGRKRKSHPVLRSNRETAEAPVSSGRAGAHA
jgi:hypothetical protein